MKYIPTTTEPHTSGTVADLNEVQHVCLELDNTITQLEVSCDKARCILDLMDSEHFQHRSDKDKMTDFDRQVFIVIYKQIQTEEQILCDYLFELEKTIKTALELNKQAWNWFKQLDTAAAIEYTRPPKR